MSKQVLLNARIFTGGADLTGNSNKVEWSSEFDAQDTTSFGSGGWGEVIAGLAETEVSAEGQWEAFDASKVDDNRWAALGGLSGWTVTPGGASVGTLAYFTNALNGSYELLGEVGSVAPWKAKAMGTWPVVRGQIGHDPGTARTATGTGAGVQLGAVAAGKQVYAALHVLSVAGTASPTITVAVESAPDNTFAAPTTRTTFAAATAVSGQIQRAAGPVTDTWWRPKWTISGTTPSFLFVVAFGIA
ncbi:hypothetical protein [Amycolatopsis eburnea]|uniref:hypothetical protein n=1 Tax=Amycolatopsis eburnea TaxID=2267691 RepID=UPI00131591A3|nr:hypothetical protein [Amycolatopsis eburnea]